MIYFNFNIRNPQWWDRFENIKSWSGSTPFKHKFWEIQIAKESELFRVEFEFTIKQDHAGVRLELALAGYTVHFNFYDVRHWNSKENRWMNYTEEKGSY